MPLIKGEVRDVCVNYFSTATKIISQHAFGHTIGLHDSAEEAYDWLLTVKAIAAVSPFFKQYHYVAQWLLLCPVFPPLIRLHSRMQREALQACKRFNPLEAESGKTTVWDGSPETRPATVFKCILNSSLPKARKIVRVLGQCDGMILLLNTQCF